MRRIISLIHPRRASRSSRVLALLLLMASLLGYMAQASSHEHPATPPAGDTLCALCALGGTTPPAAPSTMLPEVLHSRQPAPEASTIAKTTPAVPSRTRIRGPPSLH